VKITFDCDRHYWFIKLGCCIVPSADLNKIKLSTKIPYIIKFNCYMINNHKSTKSFMFEFKIASMSKRCLVMGHSEGFFAQRMWNAIP